MTRYAVLLKGINVGKAKRVAMADLRAMLSGLGYTDVTTHLQSGNAAITASDSAGKVAAAVHSGLRTALAVDVQVVVRTHAQLVAASAADPFADLADDPAWHLLGFLSGIPDQQRLDAFAELVERKHVDPQIGGVYRIVADHCYLWCPKGVLKSLFGTVDWDRNLGVTVTMRNWSTVMKLQEMTA